MKKEITWDEIHEGSKIEDPSQQLIFFLSCYFDISEYEIRNMALDDFYAMLEVFNRHMESITYGVESPIGSIKLIGKKGLTWDDISVGMSISDPFEQQLFFLSRYFKISKSQVLNENMSDIIYMTEELNSYIEEFNIPNNDEPIFNRYQILDL